MRGHDRHWHYWGAGFLAVGLAFLGYGWLLAANSKNVAMDWFAWEAFVAYSCFGLAILCGVGAAVDWPFPIGRSATQRSVEVRGSVMGELREAHAAVEAIKASDRHTEAQRLLRDEATFHYPGSFGGFDVSVECIGWMIGFVPEAAATEKEARAIALVELERRLWEDERSAT